MLSFGSSKKLIIGGISGAVGSALATQAIALGWKVAGYSLGDLQSGVPDGIVEITRADARDPQQVAEAMQTCAKCLDGVNAYVHAVGSVFLKPGHQTKDEEWREVMAVNADSAFFALRSLVPLLRSGGGGSMVFFSTVAKQIGLANHEAIAAAKGAVEGLVLSAASTYATLGIRCNAIAPGLVESKATRSLLSSDMGRKVSEKMHPLGRIGQAEEVASLALWLSSDLGSWVSGQVFTMDGGMSAILPRPKV